MLFLYMLYFSILQTRITLALCAVEWGAQDGALKMSGAQKKKYSLNWLKAQ